MNLQWPAWLQLPQTPVKSLPARGRVSRRVGLLGATATDPRCLLRLLFETEIGGVPPLQPDEETEQLVRRLALEASDRREASREAGEKPGDSAGVDAIELPPRLLGLRLPTGQRLGRSRAWEILAAGARVVAGEETVTWERHADVALIGWPWKVLGGSTRDAKVRIGGSASVARRVGRLQRVAVVIHGLPTDRAPRHASQATFVFPAGVPVAAHLDRCLRDSEQRAGDPIADPIWRETLRAVQHDAELMALVELLRRTVGADVLLYFTAAGGRSRPGFETLMDWIQDGTGTAVRSRRPARGLLAANAALWLVTLFALAQSPIGCAESRWPSGASASTHRARLEQTVTRYDGWGPGVFLRGSASARPDVERAFRIADDRVWHEQRVARLRRAAATAAAGADSLSLEERWKRGAALLAMLQAQLAERRDRFLGPDRRRFSNGGPQWDAELSRAMVIASMLSLRPRNVGFGGWVLPAALRAVAVDALLRVSGAPAAAVLDSLLGASPAVGFYQTVVGVAASGDPGLRGAYRGFDAAVPRVDRLTVREEPGLRAAALHERRIQAARLESSAPLRTFLRNSGPPAQAGEAPDAGQEGPLVLTVSVPGETGWHLDLFVPGLGQVLVQPPEDVGPDAGASLVIPRGHLGMTLHMRVNRFGRDHVASSLHERCQDSVPVIVEIEKAGTIPTYNETFFVLYTARALEGSTQTGGMVQ